MTIEQHQIGSWKSWKFGIVTREVYRKSKNRFEINDTSDGWSTCTVTAKQMSDLYTGKLSLTDLNFE